MGFCKSKTFLFSCLKAKHVAMPKSPGNTVWKPRPPELRAKRGHFGKVAANLTLGVLVPPRSLQPSYRARREQGHSRRWRAQSAGRSRVCSGEGGVDWAQLMATSAQRACVPGGLWRCGCGWNESEKRAERGKWHMIPPCLVFSLHFLCEEYVLNSISGSLVWGTAVDTWKLLFILLVFRQSRRLRIQCIK